jgi:GGDEF domain-containing protein
MRAEFQHAHQHTYTPNLHGSASTGAGTRAPKRASFLADIVPDIGTSRSGKDRFGKTVPPGLFPTIAKRIRNIDQLGRYDSDHIGLLLPHTAGDGARKIADELFKVPVIASHLSECEVFVYP